MPELNISNIDRPYDQYLFRSEQSTTNGNVETQPVKTEGSLNDIWIDTYMRSTDWAPKTRGFYIDGQTGYAEFANVYVTGTIEGATIIGSSIKTSNGPKRVEINGITNEVQYFENNQVVFATNAGGIEFSYGGSVYASISADPLGDGVNLVANTGKFFNFDSDEVTLTDCTHFGPTNAGAVTDLGASGFEFKDAYIGNTLYVKNIVLSDSVLGTGGFSCDLVADYNNNRNIGSSSKYWNNAYIKGVISIGDNIIPTSSNHSVIGDATHLLSGLWTYSIGLKQVLVPIFSPEGRTIIGIPSTVTGTAVTFQTVATHTISFAGDTSDPSLNLTGFDDIAGTYTYPDGAMYYNTVSQKMRLKSGGVWADLVTGSSAWTSDIDGDGFSLSDAGNITLRAGNNFVSYSGYVSVGSVIVGGSSIIYDVGGWAVIGNVLDITANRYVQCSYLQMGTWGGPWTTAIDSSRNFYLNGGYIYSTVSFYGSAQFYSTIYAPSYAYVNIGGVIITGGTVGQSWAKTVLYGTTSACPLPVTKNALEKLDKIIHTNIPPEKITKEHYFKEYPKDTLFVDVPNAPSEWKMEVTPSIYNGNMSEDIEMTGTVAFLYSCIKELHEEVKLLKKQLAEKP